MGCLFVAHLAELFI